jgi:hypothetical protein
MQSSGPSLHPVHQAKDMLGPVYTTCAGQTVGQVSARQPI